MLWTIVVILVILWLLSFFGGNISPNLPQPAEAKIAQTADVMEADFQYNDVNNDLTSTSR